MATAEAAVAMVVVVATVVVTTTAAATAVATTLAVAATGVNLAAATTVVSSKAAMVVTKVLNARSFGDCILDLHPSRRIPATIERRRLPTARGQRWKLAAIVASCANTKNRNIGIHGADTVKSWHRNSVR